MAFKTFSTEVLEVAGEFEACTAAIRKSGVALTAWGEPPKDIFLIKLTDLEGLVSSLDSEEAAATSERILLCIRGIRSCCRAVLAARASGGASDIARGHLRDARQALADLRALA